MARCCNIGVLSFDNCADSEVLLQVLGDIILNVDGFFWCAAMLAAPLVAKCARPLFCAADFLKVLRFAFMIECFHGRHLCLHAAQHTLSVVVK